MSEIPISFILPNVGREPDLHQTLGSLKPFQELIQIISLAPIPKEYFSPNLHELIGQIPDNLGQLINSALPHVKGSFIAVLQPGLQLTREFRTLLTALEEDAVQADYVYGNYLQKDKIGETSLVEVNPCPDDITEREDWGHLELYRAASLREMGGCDPNVRFRTEYDLRLKLTGKRSAIRMQLPLCAVPYIEPDSDPGAEALFFPGRGKFGGFSYLFMDPEEEQEIEEIFYRMLRQRNAYMENSSGVSFPKPVGKDPRVSVIIPVHNRAEFLPLAVSSVQNGKFQQFEIIIVDNASEDDTLTAAHDMAAQDDRIRVISLPDNVIAKALNAGIGEAKGDYIAQLDSDDEYTPETLDVMVKTLDDRLDWALAISYYDLMDEAGNILDEFGVIKHLEYNRNNILRVDGAGALRCWRREAIEEMGGFNEADFGHYGEDYDLVLKVGEKYEVGRVHQVLYHYRRHPGNSDILRPHSMKIENKTLARQRALQRRRRINEKR